MWLGTQRFPGIDPDGRSELMANEAVVKARELFQNGKYKEALKLLNELECSDEEAPSLLLLMLLSSYQVSNTEELVKKASNSLKSLELFARRPELNTLACYLQKENNALVPHMMEYCYISLLLAGENEINILGMAEKPVLRLNKRKSAFAEIDETELREFGTPQDKDALGYEFDPIEELDDIKVKFKGALDNPEVSAFSASADLALDLLTFFARSDEYYGTTMEQSQNLEAFHEVSYHDYWKDKPRKSSSPEKRVDSNAKRESAFDKTDVGPVPQTKEERTARLNELLSLINEEERSVLEG